MMEANLCKSHIIPKFLSKPLLEGEVNFTAVRGTKSFQTQDLIWEHLLCSRCEQLLSKYEKYANDKFFYQIHSEKPKKNRTINSNYDKLRIFFLSILWKSHISTKSQFKDINLPPLHEEEIRNAIHEENAGDVERFPFFVSTVSSDHLDTRKIIDSPMELEGNGFKIFRFVYNGVCVIQFIGQSQNVVPAAFFNFYRQNIIPIHDIPLTQLKDLVSHFSRAAKSQKR